MVGQGRRVRVRRAVRASAPPRVAFPISAAAAIILGETAAAAVPPSSLSFLPSFLPSLLVSDWDPHLHALPSLAKSCFSIRAPLGKYHNLIRKGLILLQSHNLVFAVPISPSFSSPYVPVNISQISTDDPQASMKHALPSTVSASWSRG